MEAYVHGMDIHTYDMYAWAWEAYHCMVGWGWIHSWYQFICMGATKLGWHGSNLERRQLHFQHLANNTWNLVSVLGTISSTFYWILLPYSRWESSISKQMIGGREGQLGIKGRVAWGVGEWYFTASSHRYVRHVGLMWSIFLIGHLCLSGIGEVMLLRMTIKKICNTTKWFCVF